MVPMQTISAGALLEKPRGGVPGVGLAYADPAIQNILVRLNSFFERRFPGLLISTVSSCSGHVERCGTGFRPEAEQTPYLHLRGDLEGFTEKSWAEVRQILGDVASGAARRVATELSDIKITIRESAEEIAEVLNYRRSTVSVIFAVDFVPGQTWQTLRSYWNAFEVELSRYDKNNLLTELALPHFLPDVAAEYRRALNDC